MSIKGEGNPRYCKCTKTTPVQLRTPRYRCPAHKYLRFGESIYMTPGKIVFVPPKRRDIRDLGSFDGDIEMFIHRLEV